MNSPSNIKNDFKLLKEKIGTEKRFTYPKGYTVFEVLTIIFLFGFAIWLRPNHPFTAIVIASIAGITLVWWIHNAGHDSFFKNKKTTEIWIETLGLVFLGMPQIEYHYEVHRRHHGFTNVIGKDGALDTGPIRWHRKMFEEIQPRVLTFQAWIWFFLILPLTWPLITFRCVQTLFTRRSYFRLAAFTFRWLAILWLLNFDSYFIFIPILVTGFVLGYSASLNHFHMQMDTKPIADFPANVFFTTQNLSSRSRFMTWLTGGLNFHIEHHLFPKLPSWKLRRVSPLVQEFARKHALPYQICTLPQATNKLFRRLQNPLENPQRSANES